MAVQPCTEHEDCRQDRGLAIACATLRSSHPALPPRNEVLSLGPFVLRASGVSAVKATVPAAILNAQLRLPNSVAGLVAIRSICFGKREQLLACTLEVDGVPPVGSLWHHELPLVGNISQGEVSGEDFCWRYDSSYVFGNIAAGEVVEVVFRNIAANDVLLRPTIFGIAAP